MLDQTLFEVLASKSTLINRNPSSPPVLPLPMFKDQPPVLLVFDPEDLAITVAYEARHIPGGPFVRATTRESTLYCIPPLTPVLAVADGKIVDARKQGDRDHRIVIAHGNGWLSVYRNIAYLLPAESRWATQVKAGAVIGHLASTRAGPLRPLHFELWRAFGPHDYEQVDPIRHMRRWRRIDFAARDEPASRLTTRP